MKKKKTNDNNTLKSAEVSKEDLFEVKYMSRWQLVWRALRKHKLGMISLWILIIMYIIALLADFLSPTNPYEQTQGLSFAPPSRVHWTDESGKLTAPYIYAWVMERDPETYRTTFVEGVSIGSITALDRSTGTEITFTKGEDGVIDIFLTIKTVRYALDAEGNRANLGQPDYSVIQNIKLSELELFEKMMVSETSNRTTIDSLSPSRFRELQRIGPPVKVVTERSLHRVFAQKEAEIKDIVLEAISIYNEVIDIDGEDVELAKEFLAELEISPNLLGVVVEPEVTEYETVKYPIKFFAKSWDYKLLWLFPTNIHLFGTDQPSKLLLFGADRYGRDVFSRILAGSRISMSIGLLAILITFSLGLSIGGAAGYFGGITDEILMRVTEVLMSIPSFYLLISLRAILPTSIPSHMTYLLIVVILSFIGWPGMSRVIRGMVLGLKETEFVQAAVAMGYPSSRVILRHIIPNTATYIIVAATLSIPGYILGEAGLSFLGLGITEPSASWGLMLSQAQSIKAMTEAPWLLIPGIFIFIVVMGFNLLGDALRDALDPRSLGY
ncbi:ABC transporter permease [Mesotoga sp. Brook.08.105.5.1]|uniref:ABC transporter permease n=1 Tax=unclassified Mesotoga TaxID=1184398 RepID=UPI000C196D74|nr:MULTISPECIES: ABC transporter permease [unclassified Mesotoga]PVD17674.1 ABC transporter permease [Mesotoga sp. Brook.08.105.5.1]RAM59035.1 ABC transporter permease [Mesotoga sp. SC_4PWL113PWK15]RAO95775.1 ABC transporter permease [Mesotoga sp. Brook.08.YT.4.2.5.4.]RDI94139.1 ABC transporter permease [Mesotoga sp. Brook.08.YT.4.2.5.2.]